ncbi:hypothetical protein FOZ60_000125 [Perkinsus olseni]|uniref:Carbohydrate kinase PfkB domain-containing protein n=1 Tax=Perkinsus olseni TaxID=32597 RepID=A0A7J6PQB4_PEROL|nr:hypothetical protein FOZ60_000125 [Perkinsus olseni]
MSAVESSVCSTEFVDNIFNSEAFERCKRASEYAWQKSCEGYDYLLTLSEGGLSLSRGDRSQLSRTWRVASTATSAAYHTAKDFMDDHFTPERKAKTYAALDSAGRAAGAAAGAAYKSLSDQFDLRMDRPRLIGAALLSLGVVAICEFKRRRRGRESSPPSVAVAVIGDSFCDIVCRLEKDDLPEWGEDRLAESVERVAGGSALNSAVWLKYCDPSAAVSLVKTFDETDFAGQALMDRLERSGVKVVPLQDVDHYESGVCVCLSGSKDRAFVSKRGTMDVMTCANISIPAFFEGIPSDTPRHLHLGGYYNCQGLWPGILDLVRRAKEAGCSISLSPQFDATGTWDGGVAELLGMIDMLICNEEEAQRIANTLSKLRGGLKVVVTLSDRGAFVSSVQGFTHCPAEKASTVDACGAGDAFTAAFLCSWLKDSHDEELALRQGCHAVLGVRGRLCSSSIVLSLATMGNFCERPMTVNPANDILTEEEHRYIFEKEMQVQAAKAVQEGGAKEVHCGACGSNFVSMSGTSLFCPICRQQYHLQSPFSSELGTSTSDYIVVTQQQQPTQPQLLKPGEIIANSPAGHPSTAGSYFVSP